GHVDGDGRTDLVVLHGGSEVGVMLQQQDGQLGAERSHRLPYATRYPSTGMVLADFTGDRRLDVAVANYIHGLDVVRNVTSGVAQPATLAGTYHPVPPQRVLDTRTGLGAPAARLGSGGSISLQITGAGGIPASGVSAVVLNVTVTEPTAVSFLTASPAGAPRPVASNLNYIPGQTVPNLVSVKVGQGGKIDLFNSAGTAHVLADVAGWYGTDSSAPDGRYTALTPARVLDTRSGVGAPTAKLGPASALGLQVTGRGGVPASGVSAIVLNVTATDPTAVSFLTAWPSGDARPVASNLNYVPGQTVANLVVVKVGAGGRIDLFNNAGATNVVADVAGWYGDSAPSGGGAFTPLTPARILDTRAAVGAPATRLGAAGTLGLQVAGRGGVPAAGVSAVVLNVTVTEPSATSFLTAWPNGEVRPLASNLNYGPGQTVPNLVVVKVGASGKVDLFNNAGATHVVADVAGWYGPG
ncbi:MAG TPA: VCBS repeat-containing protein, partial [Cryptosporangiaceae bacterium]|nr:VCBS repeat-containing protein [Cryptosporangiaceae bacterium]